MNDEATRLPPGMVGNFSLAEIVVLTVVAEEVADHGHCDLKVPGLASKARASTATAYSAIRVAIDNGYLTRVGRRISIVDPSWLRWLKMSDDERQEAYATAIANDQAQLGID